MSEARALELVTTGRQVKADEALKIGLVNEVVGPAQLMEKGLEMARLIATKAPIAVRTAKQAVQRGLDVDLANGCVLETALFAYAFGAADRNEKTESDAAHAVGFGSQPRLGACIGAIENFSAILRSNFRAEKIRLDHH